MWSLVDLNDDAVLHVLSFIRDARTYLSTAASCLRFRMLAMSEVEGRWCEFYAEHYALSELELKLTYPDLYDYFPCITSHNEVF